MKGTDKLASKLLQEHAVLRDKISISTGLTGADIDNLFAEVIKYLHVCNKTGVAIAPSNLVDLAWHEFILNTTVYHEFCEQNFGQYMHHIPGRPTPTQDVYERGLRLIQDEFGDLDERFWPVNASCTGGCDGNPNCTDKPFP